MDASFSPASFAPRNDDDVDKKGSKKQQQQFSAGPSSALAQSSPVPKKRKNQNPNPDNVEIIALSPTTITAKNRFVCEVCNKGFQREQNLQLHRRGHNLPWKLNLKCPKQVKRKLFLCPEITCPHHDPAQALGDLTGIKKHFFRKHGEKNFSCEKCSKKYAVLSDCKAHAKTCGTKDYRCDCGTIFSRRDSYITHKTFCDALAKEGARGPTNKPISIIPNGSTHPMGLSQHHHQPLPSPHQAMIRLGHPGPQCHTLMGLSFQSGPSVHHDTQMIPSFKSDPSMRHETLMSPPFMFGPSMRQDKLMTPAFQSSTSIHQDTLMTPAFQPGPIMRHDTMMRPIFQSRPGHRMQLPQHLYLQPRVPNHVEENKLPFGFPPPKQPSSSFDQGLMQITDQLQFGGDNNAAAATNSFTSLLNLSYFPDNGINNTNSMDSHHSSGFGNDLFNLFSSGNLMNEEVIPSLYTTSPQAIQNPSPAHMSTTALLQEATQFGSTSSSSTNIGATNPLLTFFETYELESLNADNFGAFGENTTGHLHDPINSVAPGSSSSIFPEAYDKNFQTMDQYYDDSFKDNLAAFDGEDFDFGRLEPDEGLTRDFFGIEQQVVNTGDGNVDVSSLDLQAGKCPDFGGPA